MPQMTIEYDDNTEALFQDLKSFFEVKTKVAVIRRSLAICRAAKKYSVDGVVRFENPTTGKGETYQLRC